MKEDDDGQAAKAVHLVTKRLDAGSPPCALGISAGKNEAKGTFLYKQDIAVVG